MSSTDTSNGDIKNISQQQQPQGQGQVINSNPHQINQVAQDGQTQYYFPPPPPPVVYTDENGNSRIYYPPPPPPVPIVVSDNTSNTSNTSNTKEETTDGNSGSPKITFIILGVFLLLALIIVIAIFTVKKIKRRKRNNSLKNLYKNEVDVKELTETDYKDYLKDDNNKILGYQSPNDTLNNEIYSPSMNTISSLSLSPNGLANTGYLNTNPYMLDPNYDTSLYSLRAPNNIKPIASNNNYIKPTYAIPNEILGNVSITDPNQNSLLFNKKEPVVTDVIHNSTNS